MSVLFLTGAGISANAGIATYRDGGSSWRDPELEKKSHATRYGNHLDELWDKHWGPQAAAMHNAEPTYTHKAIAAFQEKYPSIVATQNIDDLHERAGSDNVAHVHGWMRGRCMRCPSKAIQHWAGAGAPPCKECGSKKTRPDVVLFGEQLSAKLMKGLNTFAARQATHIITVGTSLNVFPVAGLAMDHIDKVTIVNKDNTVFDKWAKAVYHEDCDTVIDDILAGVDRELSNVL